uniref:Uncharacterized protein n=1 Tax=Zea mays TaxID=4577 RepID=C4J792_MAIZE|nr:unknown [Zea mays]
MLVSHNIMPIFSPTLACHCVCVCDSSIKYRHRMMDAHI